MLGRFLTQTQARFTFAGYAHWLICVCFLGIPITAFANAGLPMLAVVWPLSLPAFIPVVLLESWVVRRQLNVGWRFIFVQVTKANLLSTIVGIPLTWLALVVMEFAFASLTIGAGLSRSYPPPFVGDVVRVFLTAPWIGPFTKGANWVVPFCVTVLLIPFFFASYWIESWYVGKTLFPSDPQRGKKALWKANLFSYSVLIIGSLLWLFWGIAVNAKV